MENDSQLSAHRQRSLQAVMADGLRLYARHFSKFVRSSWLQATVYAIVAGIAMTYFFGSLLPLIATDKALMPESALWGGLLLLFLVAAYVFACAGGVSPLREHWGTDHISRPKHWWGCWPWRLTLKGITTLPRMFWQTIRHGHIGQLVAAALIMLLLVAVATLLLLMPAIILATANIEAQAGIAAGDAIDLPEQIGMLNFLTFTLCSFLQAYIHLATLFPLYYIWGGTRSGQHTENQLETKQP